MQQLLAHHVNQVHEAVEVVLANRSVGLDRVRQFGPISIELWVSVGEVGLVQHEPSGG